ncbi:DUF7158 domain-containing protein [Nonomuraea turcica]|uniref:DUF7158 domain-containing protein n=1 Tax=Nonomuraea sp. G32 TaxID=3067274 RepID=UPI00273B3E40|nr:hypothetical protein [Nonomuraea sp. G32]MDP4506502.1 hypothetical protein [Nonomuraea sp. G32]
MSHHVHHRPAAPAHAAPGPRATAPGPDGVIGWVGDRPIPREHLDRRLAGLRDGPLSAALPVPGSSEDRQLARWLTQVILTEALCEAAARGLGLAPVEGGPLDRVAAVELGSINAAAYNGSPWVRALFEHVTATAEIPSQWRARTSPQRSPRHVVHHRLFADRTSAEQAGPDDLEPLGAVSLDSLPAAIAGAIEHRPYGMLVGPVEDALGWHLATAVPASPGPDQLAVTSAHGQGGAPTPEQGISPSPGSPGPPRHHSASALPADRLLEAARRRAFARRLDELRAEKVKLVPGLEHPGDPRQPDNHHKH